MEALSGTCCCTEVWYAMCLEFLWFAELRVFVVLIVSVDKDRITTTTSRYSEHRPNTVESAEARHYFSNIIIDKEEILVIEISMY